MKTVTSSRTVYLPRILEDPDDPINSSWHAAYDECSEYDSCEDALIEGWDYCEEHELDGKNMVVAIETVTTTYIFPVKG